MACPGPLPAVSPTCAYRDCATRSTSSRRSSLDSSLQALVVRSGFGGVTSVHETGQRSVQSVRVEPSELNSRQAAAWFHVPLA